MMSIENAWSKVKHLLRAQEPRGEKAIDATFAESARQVTPGDAAGWFAHCGHQAPPM